MIKRRKLCQWHCINKEKHNSNKNKVVRCHSKRETSCVSDIASTKKKQFAKRRLLGKMTNGRMLCWQYCIDKEKCNGKRRR